MINPHTKSKVSTIICNEDMKGNAKCKNSRFEPLFRRHKGNVHGSYKIMTRWKARGRLPVCVNSTFFASSHG